MKRIIARVFLTVSILWFVLSPAQISSQELNFNQYYRFPVSLAVAYQPFTGIGNVRFLDFQINEIAGEVRIPIPGAPVIQPLLRGGVVNFSFIMEPGDTGLNWTHLHYFGSAGLGLSHRFSQDFEIGLELFGGVSQSVFNRLESDIWDASTTHGQLNVIGGAAASFSINPSYNFSIGVKPSIRYFYGLGPLDTYNGFTYGVGFHAGYRFGIDPDRNVAPIRAIRFSEIEMPPVFAAMRSFYAQEPITSFEIENTEKFSIEDVVVEFFQEGFMDSPTTLAQLEMLGAGETREIGLIATFGEQVFSTEGTTPLSGEIIATYKARGRSSEQRRSVSYELYDKNALTWDDDRKVAAFITPSDSAIRNYTSFIRLIHRDVQSSFISEPLQLAMQAFNALAELGILYQVDPTSPFTSVQENTLVVDSISFPRETLTRLTGDCDDLTVLFNTILQTAGVETAFVTTPGHIYSAVNTNVPSGSHADVHSDRSMLLEFDGKIWVLVEITLIGETSFEQAWSTGIAEYRQYDDQPERRGFYLTNESHRIFRPVALREVDLGLQYGDQDAIVQRFIRDLENLAATVLRPALAEAEEKDTARSWNRYGISAAKLGAFGEATRGFERAGELDPDDLNSRLNLGSLYYLTEDYEAALSAFQTVYQLMESAEKVRKSYVFKVLLNLSRTFYALENFEAARDYFAKAEEIDPDGVAKYSFLGSSVGDGTDASRASEAAAVDPILFFED